MAATVAEIVADIVTEMVAATVENETVDMKTEIKAEPGMYKVKYFTPEPGGWG